MSTKNSLLDSFEKVVQTYSTKKLNYVGKTEHVIFIPLELVKGDRGGTDSFVKVARDINKEVSWGCPVSLESKTEGAVKGIEVVFGFSETTDFNGILDYINSLRG